MFKLGEKVSAKMYYSAAPVVQVFISIKIKSQKFKYQHFQKTKLLFYIICRKNTF